MEDFCQYIVGKIRLEFENDQVVDISKSINVLVDRLMWSLQKKKADFECEKLIACGSMEEHTRITTEEVIEYDYLALMKFDEISLIHPCSKCQYDGAVEVLNDKGTVIKSLEVKETFIRQLMETAKTGVKGESVWAPGENYECESTNTGTLKLLLPNESDTLCMGSGSEYAWPHHGKLEFNWVPNSDDSEGIRITKVEEPYIGEPELLCYKVMAQHQYVIKPAERKYKDEASVPQEQYNIEQNRLRPDRVPIQPGLKIEADFHPILKFDIHSLAHKLKADPSRQYFLFPKGTTDGCCCWRISAYDTELKVLRQASNLHKDMFMILKFLYGQVKCPEMSILSSYDVKTGVLHHIDQCTKENGMAECVLEVLRFLSKCFFDQNLPNFALGTNLISSKMEVYNQDQYTLMSPEKCHKNRCDLVGHVLMVLGEKLGAIQETETDIILRRIRSVKAGLSRLDFGAQNGFKSLDMYKDELEKNMLVCEESS